MDSKKIPKNPKEYTCNLCSFKTKHTGDYNKHLLTAKHINMINYGSKPPKNYICECGKKYKDRHNLYRHKKNCKFESIIENSLKIESNTISVNMIIDIIKENQEIKKLLIEQNHKVSEQNNKVSEQNQEFKDIILKEFKDIFLQQNKEHSELINKFIEREPTQIINTTNNNTTNQSFNLNVFLNETCKDAMNVKEFLENLNPTIDDLENVGEKGFVKGISDIILKSLREMEINKRPIHCTDIKREVVYLKEDDTWNKDDKDNSKMKELIRKVENKNFNNIFEWQKNHPDVKILDSADYIKQNILMEKSCEAVNNEDRVRGKVLKELLKDIHISRDI
jgi:hypothetical protein